ncbi:GNAT family N-acetyltransferase [Oricola sp.]|uniref:GNAT family N-acetyltransferase n=1 Tax=Oricola sp. TaxID=1979950 RepID=UPI003BA943AC
MGVFVRPLGATEISQRFEELARLRITIFRAWPYLYDGDIGYERNYLKTYLDAPGAFVCGAFVGEVLVGAATASPLAQHREEFARPFAERGLEVGDFFYFGESVLLPAYRGQGIGVRFFEEREAEALRQGLAKCIFSAVLRPADHPLRPENHVPLDGFWRNRGYRRIEGMRTEFSWKDVGDDSETAKPMEYWMRTIN